MQYRYGSNIRYTLQRATGMIAAAFILFHVWQMHWLGAGLGGGGFELHDQAGRATGALTTATLIQQSWWMGPVYFVGVASSVFHLANGIWTSLITWGITIRPKTQRVAGYACAAFGIALFLVGVGALNGFKRFDIQSQPVAAGETTSSHATH